MSLLTSSEHIDAAERMVDKGTECLKIGYQDAAGIYFQGAQAHATIAVAMRTGGWVE